MSLPTALSGAIPAAAGSVYLVHSACLTLSGA